MNPKAFLRRWSALWLSAFILTNPLPVLAQAMGAEGENFLYRVVEGDILLEISSRYTDSPMNWSVLQEMNHIIDTLKLPIGKILRIPFSMIPEVHAPAELVHARGPVTVSGRPIQPGETLPEGGTIVTAPGGFATLRLADGSTLTVPANSAIALERLQAFKGTGLTDTIVSVESGSLESIVAPGNTGVGRFEVRTPVAITGVRGTRLRVHKNDAGAQTEVLAGLAHTDAVAAGQALLKGGQGVMTGEDGIMGSVRELLPPPTLSTPQRGPRGWQLEFAPIPGAVAYLVRVAEDPEGTRLLSSERYPTPAEIRFAAAKPGTHYVLVRAVSAEGLMGPDAVEAFQGQPVLHSSDGMPVATAYGGQVNLAEY